MFSKVKIWNFARFLGAATLLRCLRSQPKVLFYHGVVNKPNTVIETESISVADFRKQLDYLQKHHHVIDIFEFEQRFLTNEWDGNEVLLTFDDGYKNMLTTGLPLLEQFGFPFVQFFTTNNISTGDLFPTTINRLVIMASSAKTIDLSTISLMVDLNTKNRDAVCNQISRELKTLPLNKVHELTQELKSHISLDEFDSLKEKYQSILPMNWDDAKIISQSPLCTIGSHGIDHICCHENQQTQEVNRQIVESKRIIEENIGLPCDYFSYPNGNYTDFSNECVKKAGYKMGFSTKRMSIHSLTRHNIPRLYTPYDYNRFVYSMVTYPN